jgi:hypothetical protein
MESFPNLATLRWVAFAILSSMGFICPPLPAQNVLQKKNDGASITVSAGSHLVMRYAYENVPFKPYVKELYSPDGVNVLLDAPSDHLHHHALMFAVKVDGINFWEESEQPGRQKHIAFIEVKPTKKAGESNIIEQLDWIDPKGNQVVLKEQREIQIPPIEPAMPTILAWHSRFELPEGKSSAQWTGAHYHGLGIRFPEEMNTQGPFLNSAGLAGEIFRGEERLTPADWCAYPAQIDGKPVTVAMFGHPGNPRSPTLWFTMAKPFAYLSATLNLHQEPLVMKSGQALDLRYCIAVWDGRMEKTKIEEIYQWWLNWSKMNK